MYESAGCYWDTDRLEYAPYRGNERNRFAKDLVPEFVGERPFRAEREDLHCFTMAAIRRSDSRAAVSQYSPKW